MSRARAAVWSPSGIGWHCFRNVNVQAARLSPDWQDRWIAINRVA